MSDNQVIKKTSNAVQAMIERKNIIQEIVRTVLKENVHYGVIPGCPKKSLWQAGAEIIAMTFKVVAKYETIKTDIGEGHIEVMSTCKLCVNDDIVSTASALCSSMESKFRLKKDGSLQDPYDNQNKIIRYAEKRAFVAAVRTFSACSDMFTQDMGEDVEEKAREAKENGIKYQEPPKTEKTKPSPEKIEAAWKKIEDILGKDKVSEFLNEINLGRENVLNPDTAVSEKQLGWLIGQAIKKAQQ